MTHVPFLPLLLGLAVSFPAFAQGSSLQACRAIADAGARLACYDALPLPAATPAAAPAASAPAATAQSNFGLEAKAVQKAPDAIDSHIEGRFEGWSDKTRIKLANGQVWQVSDGSHAYLNLTNPKVRVRRGLFGAFFLDIEGTGRSPRVRRVE